MSKFLGLIVILWACGSAAAATLQQLSLDQMTQSATAIVRARVTGSSASFTGSTIYTHYKLQISETWKGAPGPEVMIPGGTAGGYRQSFPGVPALCKVGCRMMDAFPLEVFDYGNHTRDRPEPWGIFNVTQQTDGSIQVGRPVIGETNAGRSRRPPGEGSGGWDATPPT